MADKVLLSEAAGSVLSEDTTTPGKFRIAIIKGDTWGSSGFYPASVIESDGPKIFKQGTQMYLDHPTMSEEYERPARSVRDLAGKILSTPEWNASTKTLEADVQFYKQYHEMLSEMIEDIGISIRARGVTEYGEVEGREGPIITSLVMADSVDVVTKAGAGGAILRAIESANPLTYTVKEETVAETTVNADTLVELTKAVSGLVEAFQEDRKERAEALAEAAKEKEEAKPDPLAVALAVSESGLPKPYMSRVIEAVAGGAELEEAVKTAKAEVDEIAKALGVKESKDTKKVTIGAPQTTDLNESVETSAGLIDISADRIKGLLDKIVKVA